MKYALIGDEKSTPRPRTRGICIHCGGEMVSKCGKVMIWHWAHKTTEMCDPWWENKSHWHRSWKNHFPEGQQEVAHVDPATGERHIADVKNLFGLVIEFQRSLMSEAERLSREDFYQDMIWVVDGTRGSLDSRYFMMGTAGPIQKKPLLYQIEWWGRSRFFNFWGASSKRIYLDFGNEGPWIDVIWRLVSFDPNNRIGIVAPVMKKLFIEDCISGREIHSTFIGEDQDDERFSLPRPLVEVEL
jgi:competence protein CoiA